MGIGYRPLVVGSGNNLMNCRVLRAQTACKKLEISLCGRLNPLFITRSDEPFAFF